LSAVIADDAGAVDSASDDAGASVAGALDAGVSADVVAVGAFVVAALLSSLPQAPSTNPAVTQHTRRLRPRRDGFISRKKVPLGLRARISVDPAIVTIAYLVH
jgi:hypothetical protein